ncbi:endoribonuclease [Mycolicibacterium phlei]|uniref:RidA family protein n=1 Tax=Mycobacteroides chelonae TaxID=1774 RepID=UPI000618D318|nr:RidA family protein [Mycobacteroides chelonae]VEG17694.1 endoribonuclease [Mycolicibacterium phlei]AKC39410.1 endoribonuclease L-PSP [Mycobacteroides chelonae]ANA98878.1 endoribonuclease L-PSP [Mycobacteroides chelonae CCUG 47445]OLT72614.1 reactive intermediate/imine deaminase [Mycobacteroides chelonae]ORV11941.1 reactive intermediate/imine deaminase [Mycobacteroides chelonae]
MAKAQIETGAAPDPVGAYSQAVRIGDTLQVSGQVGINAQTRSLAGETVYAQTVQTLRNIEAILTAAGADFDDVLMLRVFLHTPEGFAELNKAFEDTISKPYPARTTLFGGLPPGLLVEIDALAKLSGTED